MLYLLRRHSQQVANPKLFHYRCKVNQWTAATPGTETFNGL